MPNCSVLQCRNESRRINLKNGGVSYHRFPKGPIMEKWITATGRVDWMPTKFSTICSEHFLQSDIVNSRNGFRYTKPRAVPTIRIVNILNQIPEESSASPVPEPFLTLQMPSASGSQMKPSPTHSLNIDNIKSEDTDEDSRHSEGTNMDEEDPWKRKVELDETSSLRQTILNISEQLNALRDNDSYDAFGRYVASVMRSLPTHRALEVQPKIVDLLVKAVNETDARRAELGVRTE